jgi:hypothetical protein
MTPKSNEPVVSSIPWAQISRFRRLVSWIIETDKEFRIRQKMVDDCHERF